MKTTIKALSGKVQQRIYNTDNASEDTLYTDAAGNGYIYFRSPNNIDLWITLANGTILTGEMAPIDLIEVPIGTKVNITLEQT